MLLDVDLILIVVFLIINLGLGLWHGKDVKSIYDFALGGRNFSTATLTSTLMATWIGGSTFSFGLYVIYMVGILSLCCVGQIFNLLFIAYVLVPRMQEFLGKLSIPEVMGTIYGKYIRVISAICCIIISATFVAMQIKVFSTIFNHFFVMSGNYPAIISSIIVIIYSAFGGIRSIVLTDVFQFLTFGAFIPTLSLLIWNSFGNWDAIMITLTTNPMFSPKLLIDYSNTTVLKYYGVFFYCLVPCFAPSIFHRVLIARNTAQASKAFGISAIICLVFWIFTFFVGIILLSSGLKIDANNLLPYIIDSYAYPGFKAMVVIGVIAMIISTADSDINSAAVIFINDLLKPLGGLNWDDELELKYIRLSSVAIGVMGLCISLFYSNILDILLFGSSFYTSIVGIPLLFTILGFRSTSRVILSAMIAGAITTYIWNKYLNTCLPIGDILPATFANSMTMMLLHYGLKEPGGWRVSTSKGRKLQKSN